MTIRKILAIVATMMLGTSFALAHDPHFRHVVIVPLENHSYSEALANMPYLNSLISQYGLATNFYADTHPSQGNYFLLTTGQILGFNDSNESPADFPLSVENIGSDLEASGMTWKGYVECLQHPGDIPPGTSAECPSGVPNSTDNYYVRHDPMAFFTNVTQTNRVPFDDPNVGWAADLNNSTLPNFSFISPDGCDNGHDRFGADGTTPCGPSSCQAAADPQLCTADHWLQTNIDPLISGSSQGAEDFRHHGLLIIIFDEDDETTSPDCLTTQTGQGCGGHVACVLISPAHSKPGYTQTGGDPGNFNNSYEHENLLRLMYEGLRLTSHRGGHQWRNEGGPFPLYPGAANDANDMSEFFTTRPAAKDESEP
jgi:phosphatidylinositol-3-phosphatase